MAPLAFTSNHEASDVCQGEDPKNMFSRLYRKGSVFFPTDDFFFQLQCLRWVFLTHKVFFQPRVLSTSTQVFFQPRKIFFPTSVFDNLIFFGFGSRKVWDCVQVFDRGFRLLDLNR